MENYNFVELSVANKISMLNQIALMVKKLQVFFPHCSLRLGGSIAMALTIPEFRRPVHDIDIIVRSHNLAEMSEAEVKQVFKSLAWFLGSKATSSCSDGVTLCYAINGVYVNLLYTNSPAISHGDYLCGVALESMKDILVVKKAWDRVKDHKDIELLETWIEKNIDLPF